MAAGSSILRHSAGLVFRVYREKFDLKNQRSVRRDAIPGPAAAIGQLGGIRYT